MQLEIHMKLLFYMIVSLFVSCNNLDEEWVTTDDPSPTRIEQGLLSIKAPEEHNIDLRVLQFNLYIESGVDSIERRTSKNTIPDNWKVRFSRIRNLLKYLNPDIVSLQEVGNAQMNSLTKWAKDEYAVVQSTQYYDVTLWYRRKVWKELAREVLPYSSRKKLFSRAVPRAFLLVHLQNRATGKPLMVLTAHIDNNDVTNSIHEVLQTALAKKAPDEDLILLGDLNTSPTSSNYQHILSQGFQDPFSVLNDTQSSPQDYPKTFGPNKSTLDYIFYRGPGLTPVAWTRVAPPEDLHKISDHHPIVVDFGLVD